MDVTEKIRKLRQEKGYSQQYMALKLNISQNAYCKIERGETRLSMEKLGQLAGALDTSIEKMISQEEEATANDKVRLENLEREVNFLKAMLKELLNGGG